MICLEELIEKDKYIYHHKKYQPCLYGAVSPELLYDIVLNTFILANSFRKKSYTINILKQCGLFHLFYEIETNGAYFIYLMK